LQERRRIAVSALDGDPDNTIIVEILVLEPFYRAARARAAIEGDTLSGVAREVVRRAGEAAALEPKTDDFHVDRWPRGIDRKRVRFTIKRGIYQTARDNIRNSGSSVPLALKEGLRYYAETGRYLTERNLDDATAHPKKRVRRSRPAVTSD